MVVFWFHFGQGVNKSGGEALVAERPADATGGSGDPACQAKVFLRRTNNETGAFMRYIYLETWACAQSAMIVSILPSRNTG